MAQRVAPPTQHLSALTDAVVTHRFLIVVAMPKRARRPDPQPLEANDRLVVLVGMALWAVAFVVLMVGFRDDLRRHDTEWWLWACGIGFVLGLYGLRFVSRRRRTLQRDRDQE